MSEKQQPELFYESELEALRNDVNALGGTKTVGHWFWPEKSPEAARNMVNDRLNAEKRDRFSDEQRRLIIRKAREGRGFSATLIFLCDDTGFERPRPRDPGDEREQLQRAFIESVQLQRALLERLERLPAGTVLPFPKAGA